MTISVHPRGRGEHLLIAVFFTALHGSSPRARGTQLGAAVSVDLLRFIPAGAGNTWCPRRTSTPFAVHPRGRGEHTASGYSGDLSGGSSPRARGTPLSLGAEHYSLRFIPAGAGNTSSLMQNTCGITVHPRGRGEHVAEMVHDVEVRRFIPAGAGNTTWRWQCRDPPTVHPRGRGEHAGPRRETKLTGRFIPAGAGNTPWGRVCRRHRAVHPRGRGEHGIATSSRRPVSGSSPRARGTLAAREADPRAQRFIPAGAGNTRDSRRSSQPQPVHPRGRGEHASTRRRLGMCCGSSPRARGTPGR